MKLYKQWLTRALIAGTAIVGVSGAARAQEGFIYFAHGIPARDLAPAANPDLPIDISVGSNGMAASCLVKGAISGSFSGPFALPSGTYDVAMSQASTVSPCSNEAAVTGTVTIGANQSVAMIASVNATGSPTGYVTPIDFTAVPSGQARVIFANAANAAPLTLTTSNGTISGIVPGAVQTQLMTSGTVNSAQIGDGTTVYWGPGPIVLPNRSVLLVIAGGSVSAGSLNVVGHYWGYVR